MLKRAASKGFTLVEMALVLVVIGLILGAVSVGKDMQRNAEYKKIKQKFIDQWVQAYNEHYSRLGYLPGDAAAGEVDSAAVAVANIPTLTVNGSKHDDLSDLQSDPASAAVDSNGVELCEAELLGYMAAAGIEVPPGRGDGAEEKYVYLDSNGNPQQLRVCFQWSLPGNTAGNGNTMVIRGVTPDLARFLDSLIDGQVDGEDGRFRRTGLVSGAPDFVASAWPAGNDRNLTNTGDVSDIQQIVTVAAVMQMNQ